MFYCEFSRRQTHLLGDQDLNITQTVFRHFITRRLITRYLITKGLGLELELELTTRQLCTLGLGLGGSILVHS